MEASTDLFINIIRNHRIIYDTTSIDFKNVNKKEDEWVSIAKDSRMSVEAAKKRYASLRQKYAREKKKEITCNRNKETFRPSVFFDRLAFLNDFVKPRRTYTNDVDGMNLLDDDLDELAVPEGTRHNGFFSDGGYSLAQEQADDEEALRELEREGLLQVENRVEILPQRISETEDGEVFVLDINRNEEEIAEMRARQSTYETNRARNFDVRADEQVSVNIRGTPCTITRPAVNIRDTPCTITRPVHVSSVITQSENICMPTSQLSIEKELASTASASNRNTNAQRTLSSMNFDMQDRCTEPRRDGSSNSRQADKSQTTQPTMSVNRNQSTGKVTSSILSKSSPVVQAVSSISETNRSSGKSANSTASMDAIKAKMEAYLTACNDKLHQKTDRSPHARFLAYLGTKMENVARDKMEALEQELLSVVYRYSEKN